jgi:hypothetical protein
MSTVSFNGLLIISAIAVAAPFLVASVKRVKLPSAVPQRVHVMDAVRPGGHPRDQAARLQVRLHPVRLAILTFWRVRAARPHRSARVSTNYAA